MKFSDYTRQLRPDPLSYVTIAYKGENFRVQLKNLLSVVRLNRTFVGTIRDDLLNLPSVSGASPFSHIPLGFYVAGYTGIPTQIDSEPGHPGITRFVSAAASGTGGGVGLDPSGGGTARMRIFGGEVIEIVWRTLSITNCGARVGCMDVSTLTATPGEAVYINISNATVTGKTYRGGTPSTTPSSYTLSNNTWYRGVILVNEDATEITFEIYSEFGALLWSDTITDNIPQPQSLNGLSPAALFLSTAIGIQNLVDIDYMAYSSSKVLVR